MTAPTVTAISPQRGKSVGETFVEITGTDFNLFVSGATSAKVFFGTEEATEVQVLSSTKLYCLTPRGIADQTVDVIVQNITEPGPVLENGTLSGGFTYKRPSIATPDDNSNFSTVAVVIRRLIEELRNCVLANTHHRMHPEYADAVNAALEQENQAEAPSLKLTGPDITQDRFYSINGRKAVAKAGDLFDIYDDDVYGLLQFQFVGVGRSKGETLGLFRAVTEYFKKTPFLKVFANGVDDSEGFAELEMSVIWEQQGNFISPPIRDGTSQFSGGIRIRGVPLTPEIIGESALNQTGATLEIEPI